MTDVSESSVLRVDDAGPVRVLTLHRPEKRNALSEALRTAVVTALDEAADAESVHAVVLTGAGESFCAGFDLAEVLASPDRAALFARANAYHRRVHHFPKPLVAAVNGAALAGGFDLALMCDIVVAGSTARFGQPQVTRGLPASFDLVAYVLGVPVAAELCLTGRTIDADEAQRIGLVPAVVDSPEVLAAALATATAAATGGRSAKASLLRRRPEFWG